MKIAKTMENTKTCLSLEGRLDTTTSPELHNALVEAFKENAHVIIDFKGISYVSSAGLRVLLMAHKTAVAQKGSMVLRNVAAEIMEILEITCFSDFLTIEPRQG